MGTRGNKTFLEANENIQDLKKIIDYKIRERNLKMKEFQKENDNF